MPARNALFLIFVWVSASLLTACATSPLPEIYDEQAFLNGEVKLECVTFDCSSRWRGASAVIASLYDTGDWNALAATVTNTQYDTNLAYFYLGRAAEELGANAAARVYFDRVGSASRDCEKSIFSNCAGIDVDRETQRSIDFLAGFGLVEAQTVLAKLGLYTAAIDGIIGRRTIAALKQFQADRGMEETGTLTAATRRALAELASPETRRGSQSGQVAQVDVETTPAPVAAPVTVSQGPQRAPDEPPQTEPQVNKVAKAKEPPYTGDRVASTVPAAATEPTQPVQTASASESIKPIVLERLEKPEESEVSEASEEAEESIESTDTDAPPEPAPPATPEPLAIVSTRPEEPPTRTAADTVAERTVRTRVKLEVELLSEADPFAEVLAVLQQGAWVEVINRGSEWSIISHNRKVGYVYTDYLE